MVRWRKRQMLPIDDAMLQQIHVLSLLPPAERAKLLPDSRSGIYPPGEEIDVDSSEQEPQLLGIAAGGVRIDVRADDGYQMPIHTVGASEVFVLGKEGWLGPGEPVITAIQGSTLCSVPLAIAEDVIDACPTASRALRVAERRLLREAIGLAGGQFRGPEGRIRHVLLLDSRFTGTVEHTHEFLAARARTDRPKVSRVVGKLVKEGSIAVDSREHRITIRDRDRLAHGDRS